MRALPFLYVRLSGVSNLHIRNPICTLSHSREEESVPEKHRLILYLQGANLLRANPWGADLQGTYLKESKYLD